MRWRHSPAGRACTGASASLRPGNRADCRRAPEAQESHARIRLRRTEAARQRIRGIRRAVEIGRGFHRHAPGASRGHAGLSLPGAAGAGDRRPDRRLSRGRAAARGSRHSRALGAPQGRRRRRQRPQVGVAAGLSVVRWRHPELGRARHRRHALDGIRHRGGGGGPHSPDQETADRLLPVRSRLPAAQHGRPDDRDQWRHDRLLRAQHRVRRQQPRLPRPSRSGISSGEPTRRWRRRRSRCCRFTSAW